MESPLENLKPKGEALEERIGAQALMSMSALIDGDVFRKIDGIYGRGHAGGSDRASLRIASVGPRLGPVLLRVQKTVADGGRVAGLM